MKDNNCGHGGGSSCGHGHGNAMGYGIGYVYGYGYKDGSGYGGSEESEINNGLKRLNLSNNFWTLDNNYDGWEKGADFGSGDQNGTGRG